MSIINPLKGITTLGYDRHGNLIKTAVATITYHMTLGTGLSGIGDSLSDVKPYIQNNVCV